MEGDINESGKVLCLNSCGFYGSVITENYCSMCYKDFLRKKGSANPELVKLEDISNEPGSLNFKSQDACQVAPEIKTFGNEGASSQDGSPSASSSAQSIPAVQVEDNNAASGNSPAEKKKLRCGFCKKKVGLTGFTCRCGGLFCSVHRYSDKHECNFDYRQHGACEIRKNNPQVLSRKIEKI